MREDPRVTRSREAIEAAATDQFLARGYVGAGVDEIAASARVSKRTIYNIYGDKEALFAALMDRTVSVAERFSREVAPGLSDADDLERELAEVAERLAATVVSERIIRLRRLIIGEAERFPEIAARYYRSVPGATLHSLAEAFGRLRDRGALVLEDPVLAAEHFAFLVMGAHLDRALFTAPDRLPTPATVADDARRGAATFLRAYGAATVPSGRPTKRRERGPTPGPLP